MKYNIESQLSGAIWLITRTADNARLILQGDDALAFERRLELMSRNWLEDDVCEEYCDVIRPEADVVGGRNPTWFA